MADIRIIKETVPDYVLRLRKEKEKAAESDKEDLFDFYQKHFEEVLDRLLLTNAMLVAAAEKLLKKEE